MIIGRCIGEPSLIEVTFISKDLPKVGEYVTLEYDGRCVLGMIESMVRGSVSLNVDIYDPDTIAKIREIEGDDYYIKGKVTILGDVDDNLKIPRTPAPPGTPVKLATKEILDPILRMDNSIKLGHLISQENVSVNVDVNKMVSRHLAILAMTGAGKSNTVSVIVDGLLSHNGCIMIFDMHSEYSGAEFTNGEVNIIDPIINPKYMEFNEIKKLARIGSNATIQERYFRKAFIKAQELIQKSEAESNDFLEILYTILSGWYNDEDMFKSDKNNIMDVMNKIEDLNVKYEGSIFAEIRIGILSSISDVIPAITIQFT